MSPYYLSIIAMGSFAIVLMLIVFNYMVFDKFLKYSKGQSIATGNAGDDILSYQEKLRTRFDDAKKEIVKGKNIHKIEKKCSLSRGESELLLALHENKTKQGK